MYKMESYLGGYSVKGDRRIITKIGQMIVTLSLDCWPIPLSIDINTIIL